MSLLLLYIAVVVTAVALGVRRAIRGLTVLTKPRLSISTVTLDKLDGIACDPQDWGLRACCVTLASPLPLQLKGISYAVQVGEHDQAYGALTRDRAVAVLRARGFDDRAFAIPHLALGAYVYPGQDTLIAALTMPVARQVHRLDAVLALADASGRTVRFTASAIAEHRLPGPIRATERQNVG